MNDGPPPISTAILRVSSTSLDQSFDVEADAIIALRGWSSLMRKHYHRICGAAFDLAQAVAKFAFYFGMMERIAGLAVVIRSFPGGRHAVDDNPKRVRTRR
jgi:hypothetical protein